MSGGPQDRVPGRRRDPGRGDDEWLVLAQTPPAPTRSPRRGVGAAVVAALAVVGAVVLLVESLPPASTTTGTPPTVTTGTTPAAVVPPPVVPPPATGRPAGRACSPSDLAWTTAGWDSAVGNSSTSVQVTNVSDSWCRLAGYPDLRIDQGGKAMGLTVTRTTTRGFGGDEDAADPHPRPVRLEPRRSAVAPLWWRGYRAAADQHTPQRLFVQLPHEAETDVPLTEGPAPFDLVPGAHLQLAPWTPAPR